MATFVIPEAVQVLERTPSVLEAMLAGLGDAWLDADEGPDTFSPRAVMGHLIHGEETDWIPRLRIILEHGTERAFTPFDRFAFRARYGGARAEQLLGRFAELRRANLATLRQLALTPDQLRLQGRHPELGLVTVSQLLATWVAHDLDHLSQIVRVLAKRYTDAVGPWRAYLRVLGS